VKSYFAGKGYPLVDVDGVRVYIKSGWGLVRASNTGPEIIVRYEAKNQRTWKPFVKSLKKPWPQEGLKQLFLSECELMKLSTGFERI